MLDFKLIAKRGLLPDCNISVKDYSSWMLLQHATCWSTVYYKQTPEGNKKLLQVRAMYEWLARLIIETTLPAHGLSSKFSPCLCTIVPGHCLLCLHVWSPTCAFGERNGQKAGNVSSIHYVIDTLSAQTGKVWDGWVSSGIGANACVNNLFTVLRGCVGCGLTCEKEHF